MESWRDLPLVLVHGPTSWTDLPTVLKSNILSLLPVKTLVISTAVCKSWYTHIKNPTFISAHINCSTRISQSLIFAPISSNSFTLVTNNHQTKLHLPFTPRFRSVTISGSSCHGLLLLVESSDHLINRDLYLWNPSLNKHKHLPFSSSSLANVSDIHNTYPVVGFGFSKTHNDYRIVRILYVGATLNFDVRVAPAVEVYSLREDCWRKVNVSVTRMASHLRWVCIDGVIYWLEARLDLLYKSLVWFDLNDEKFGEMELPPKFRDGVGRDAHGIVCEYKGLLGFCVFAKSHDNGLWTMRVSLWVRKGNWVNQLKVVFKDRLCCPFKFTKSGDLILEAADNRPGGGAPLQIHEPTVLASYDLEKQHYKHLGNDGPYSVDTSFEESLYLFEERKPRFRTARVLQ